MRIGIHHAGEALFPLADPLIVQKPLGDLLQEAAWRVVIDLIIQHPLGRVADEQHLPGTGDGHVTQAAFFFQTGVVVQAAAVGENALFQPHHEHDGEFQSLGAVDGHQRHVGGFQVGVIQIGDQRDIFQIVLQRGIVRGLFVFRYRAQKFLHVFQPRLALIGQVALVHILQAGALQHMLHKFADAHVLPGQHQLVHQLSKIADALAGTGGQAFGNIHQRAVQGHVLLGSVAAQLRHGAVADGALGLIDDALQAGVIGRIDDGPQIGHDVLDFFAVIEAQTAVNTVGNARPHQHFFQHTALGVGAVQYGHIAVFPMAAVLLGDAVAHPRRFLPLVSGGEEFDGFACG